MTLVETITGRRSPPKIDVPNMPAAPSLDMLESDLARYTHDAYAKNRADPLHPDVAKLLSTGIVAAAKQYGEELVEAARRYEREAVAYRERTESYAASMLSRAEDQARDVAEAHAEMCANREKFFAIAEPQPESAAVNKASERSS